MTRAEAIKMAKAKLKCLVLDTSGLEVLCDNRCEDCSLAYEQGNRGQQKEWLEILINDAQEAEEGDDDW